MLRYLILSCPWCYATWSSLVSSGWGGVGWGGAGMILHMSLASLLDLLLHLMLRHLILPLPLMLRYLILFGQSSKRVCPASWLLNLVPNNTVTFGSIGRWTAQVCWPKQVTNWSGCELKKRVGSVQFASSLDTKCCKGCKTYPKYFLMPFPHEKCQFR